MYGIDSCFGKLLTKSAFTVSIDVISFGSNARLVSFLYCKKTKPVEKKYIFTIIKENGKYQEL